MININHAFKNAIFFAEKRERINGREIQIAGLSDLIADTQKKTATKFKYIY